MLLASVIIWQGPVASLLGGAAASLIPGVGPLISGPVIKLGIGVLSVGLADKGRKAYQVKPVFDKEKVLFSKKKKKEDV